MPSLRRLHSVRVLVCGGRDYNDREAIGYYLDSLKPRPEIIINGGARGADSHANAWAVWRQVRQWVFYPDWETHGRAAGPMRNQRMLDEAKPDLVVAFPGGSGTADMVSRAKKAGVRTVEITPPSE